MMWKNELLPAGPRVVYVSNIIKDTKVRHKDLLSPLWRYDLQVYFHDVPSIQATIRLLHNAETSPDIPFCLGVSNSMRWRGVANPGSNSVAGLFPNSSSKQSVIYWVEGEQPP